MLAVVGCCAVAWVGGEPLVPPAGGRGGDGSGWAWTFLALLALAFGAYVVGLRLVARTRPAVRAVVAVAIVTQAAPLVAPLLLSTDAWTYWSYGRIARVHGESPYERTPAEFPRDPASEWAGERWRDRTSVYGPGFTLASEGVAATARDSEDAAAWIFKALAALAAIAATVAAASAAARPALAAAFAGWNPLLAVHVAGGGHNDAWVGALVVAALALGPAGRRQAAGVAWALAIAVKWLPLVLLPLRAIEARATGRRVGHVGFALAIAAVAAAATWRYGLTWVDAIGPLAENAAETTSFALPHRAAQLGIPEPLAIGAFAAVFVAAYAWLAREAWRGRARLALAAGLLVACSPYVAPWYLAWVVPLAAVEEDRVARALALGLTAYLLPQTIPV